jgi:hypothetical protein
LLDVAATPEQIANLANFSKLGLDDDVVWIETAAYVHPPPPMLVHAPSLQRLSRRAETPVRRADLLLE